MTTTNVRDSHLIVCAYCGKTIELRIDASASGQNYVEDRQVCCQPINISAHIDEDEEAAVKAMRRFDSYGVSPRICINSLPC